MSGYPIRLKSVLHCRASTLEKLPLESIAFTKNTTQIRGAPLPRAAAPLNSLQQFRVITNGARKADLSVTITSPSGAQIRAHVIPTAEGYLVNFTPTQVGEYLLAVCFGGTPLTPQPIRLRCRNGSDAGRVRASGAGLGGGTVGRPAEFVIDTRGAGQGGLGVTVEGPCEAAINCRDNGDGTCNVAYLPTEPGDYTVNITFDERHIVGSPFQALVGPPANVRKIKVTGVGIQPHGKDAGTGTGFPTSPQIRLQCVECVMICCSGGAARLTATRTRRNATEMEDSLRVIRILPVH